jgi:hypothetical protein
VDVDRFIGFAGGVLFGDSGVEVEYLTATMPRQPVDRITEDQIAEVTHLREKPEHERDYNDNDVHALARLNDGRWAGVHGWCDTTGWDCQAGVTWFVGSRDEVIRDGLTEEDRNHWGLTWPAQTAADHPRDRGGGPCGC